MELLKKFDRKKHLEEWKKKNPLKVKQHSKKRRVTKQLEIKKERRCSQLKSNYGITLSEYNEMFNKQGGCCAICKRHQTVLTKTLAVDHCHTTGKVRGLLCNSCNWVLGTFQDDINLFVESIKYLKQ